MELGLRLLRALTTIGNFSAWKGQDVRARYALRGIRLHRILWYTIHILSSTATDMLRSREKAYTVWDLQPPVRYSYAGGS